MTTAASSSCSRTCASRTASFSARPVLGQLEGRERREECAKHDAELRVICDDRRQCSPEAKYDAVSHGRWLADDMRRSAP